MTGEHPATTEQLQLLHAVAAPRAPEPPPRDLAAQRPIAVVQVDSGLPHLDRPFEYVVPAALAERAVPGCRLKVRFAGQDVDGYLLERRDEPEHTGRLAPIRKVVSDEAVLTPELVRLCRAVAARYAGTLGDVLRLAIPPRHARAEKALAVQPPEPLPLPASDAERVWRPYPAGPALLQRVGSGEGPTASWLVAPSTDPATDWPMAAAELARAALAGGRGALLVVPDGHDVDRLDTALAAVLGGGQHVRLTAEQGPQARYTAWLKVLRGHVRCVVGTRAAAFAPVHDLGLALCWDDGDDSLAEPRAPYPHAREVLALRAEQTGAALVLGGHVRSVPAQAMLEAGRLRPVDPDQPRAARPRVIVTGDDLDVERSGPAATAHLPTQAWRAAKEALTRGPVLVQVPRRGYLPSLSCSRCRTPARCTVCHGPLALAAADASPTCRWCGHVERDFRCLECEGTQLRSSVVGARRTAEELGRAFPGVPLLRSAAGEVRATVPDEPSLVVATPGAEPVPAAGYAAALLLDAWALLDRPVLEAATEALRRWTAAAALTRGGGAGGVVVLCGSPRHTTIPAVEALVRWAPGWFAERELAERRELRLPPSTWIAELTGTRLTLSAALEALDLPPDVDVLGPLPAPVRAGTKPGDEPLQRVLLRTGLGAGAPLAQQLVALKGQRSARKDRTPLTVRIDPEGAQL